MQISKSNFPKKQFLLGKFGKPKVWLSVSFDKILHTVPYLDTVDSGFEISGSFGNQISIVYFLAQKWIGT